MNRFERELFRRELFFLKAMRRKVTGNEARFVEMLDDQIKHLEAILHEETENIMTD
ncbi:MULTISPECIES: hypothetical protein [Shouchella]|uniref:Uncharacterized protein n=1 Tax=Shouchella hunanensis TaxID=766894 RepID=A0ABY7W1Z8_9BACI|nr:MULTISPECIES: hypothetical protein [Shouchella]WDF01975.1 hypothetical protein PQ477_10605 [Shouchella hunanensis]GAF20381.1 hypothetical protein JCM19047_10 [Bacillus sp. JCM 19047]